MVSSSYFAPLDCPGQNSKNNKSFLKRQKPWGIILFSRNIKDFYQLKKLIKDIKKIFKDPNYPILIDQEGGKVSRLNKILNQNYFSQDHFGRIYKKDKKLFLKNYKIYINNVSKILRQLGQISKLEM